MFPKVSHVEVNIELLNTFVYVLLNILLKSFKDFDELYKILRRFTYGTLSSVRENPWVLRFRQIELLRVNLGSLAVRRLFGK